MSITYAIGDVTKPQGDGKKIICHIVNTVGAWCAGVVLAISRRWPEPEAAYREWYHGRGTSDFSLGNIQMVPVKDDILVANMLAQEGVSHKNGPPIRYDALTLCLANLAAEANRINATVHMPRIGCGLAGGNWQTVEPLVKEQLCDKGVRVTVYDLKG